MTRSIAGDFLHLACQQVHAAAVIDSQGNNACARVARMPHGNQISSGAGKNYNAPA
jgi:hypothetical protein